MLRDATALVNDEPLEEPARLWSLHEVLALGTKREPLSTGFGLLDDFTSGGIAAGESIVIGGPPGSMKTTFVAKMAWSLACRGALVVFAALDEDYRRVARKVAARSGERYSELLSEYPPVLDRLRAQMDTLGAEILFPNPVDGLSIEAIGQLAQRAAEGRRVVYVIDHLQLTDSDQVDKKDSESVALTRVVDAVLRLTKNGDSVIAISEVTKAALAPGLIEASPLSVFAGSRRIASRFDLPLVLLKDGDLESRVFLQKNRLGPTGTFRLLLNPETWNIEACPDADTPTRTADDERAEDLKQRAAILDVLGRKSREIGWHVADLKKRAPMREAAFYRVIDALEGEGVIERYEGPRKPTQKGGKAPVFIRLTGVPNA